MAFDPGANEVVVGREHDEPVACSLRVQAREERIDLRRIYALVRFHFRANVGPDLLEFLVIHRNVPFALCSFVNRFEVVFHNHNGMYRLVVENLRLS